MNKGELKTAVMSDTHRADYAPHMDRFVAQAEEFIGNILESYFLKYTLTDADRVAGTGVYTIPGTVRLLRHVFNADGVTLGQTDESQVARLIQANSTVPSQYAVRPNSELIIGGVPGEEAEFVVHYFGMPAPLDADEDENDLLTAQSHLYQAAVAMFVHKRQQNMELYQQAQNDTVNICRALNRSTKKLIGGAPAVGPYNVGFRSSY